MILALLAGDSLGLHVNSTPLPLPVWLSAGDSLGVAFKTSWLLPSLFASRPSTCWIAAALLLQGLCSVLPGSACCFVHIAGRCTKLVLLLLLPASTICPGLWLTTMFSLPTGLALKLLSLRASLS